MSNPGMSNYGKCALLHIFARIFVHPHFLFIFDVARM